MTSAATVFRRRFRPAEQPHVPVTGARNSGFRIINSLHLRAAFSGPSLLLAACVSHSIPTEGTPTEPAPTATIAFVGDVIAGRSGRTAALLPTENMRALHTTVQDFVGDFPVIGNLESPVCAEMPLISEPGVWLGIPQAESTALTDIGITHWGAANNHAADCAVPSAMFSTFPHGTAEIITSENMPARVFFINASRMRDRDVPGLLHIDVADFVCAQMPDHHQESGPAIVYVHWGNEQRIGPTPQQRAAVHTMFACGISLVVAHGSHVAEPIEWYGEHAVAWGLGNAATDMNDGSTSGIVLRATWTQIDGVWVLAELVKAVAPG
jgi:hypothetical protein